MTNLEWVEFFTAVLAKNLPLLETYQEDVMNFSPDLFDYFATFAQTDSTSLFFDVSECGMTNEPMAALAECLATNTSLFVLNISNNEKTAAINTATIKPFIDALFTNHTLKEFIWGAHHIGPEGARLIANLLLHNHTLTILGLGDNQIGPQGAIDIANALLSNHTLTELSLRNNQIGPLGAKAIASALQKNTSLEICLLASNQIGPLGAQDFAMLLQYNTTLTHLVLEDNDIGDEGIQAITAALEKNFVLSQALIEDGSFHQAKINTLTCANPGIPTVIHEIITVLFQIWTLVPESQLSRLPLELLFDICDELVSNSILANQFKGKKPQFPAPCSAELLILARKRWYDEHHKKIEPEEKNIQLNERNSLSVQRH